MREQEKAIEVSKLTVSYEKTLALWDLTFSVDRGRLMGIIGPNGAGKSSLLQALLGMVKPFSGQVLFYGRSFKEGRRRIAYIPQKGSIDWNFPITVFDVVLMGRYGHLRGLKWYRKRDRMAAYQVLQNLGMESLAHRQIDELSGGQQQRLFIARALLQEADIFLLDEPFSGIDKSTEHVVIEILKRLKAEGKTLLVVHHDLHTVKKYFDSVLILKTALVACGEIEKTFTSDNLDRAFDSISDFLKEVASASPSVVQKVEK